MGKPGVRKVHRYSVEFKLTAVKLSHMPGVAVQTVTRLRASIRGDDGETYDLPVIQ